MSDEAHRFIEKDLGNKLDAALPNAYHFGFTGTPAFVLALQPCSSEIKQENRVNCSQRDQHELRLGNRAV
jgi:hypothetical protein